MANVYNGFGWKKVVPPLDSGYNIQVSWGEKTRDTLSGNKEAVCMAKCAICGTEENVFRYKVHIHTQFQPVGTSDMWEGRGDCRPVSYEVVRHFWKEAELCPKCAGCVWGCTTHEDETYPDGYTYVPYPVAYYYCAGCDEFHAFENSVYWYRNGYVPSEIHIKRFSSVFTAGKGNQDCNLPPYTTSASVPYTNQAIGCEESFENGSFTRATGLSLKRCTFCGRYTTPGWAHMAGNGTVCSDCWSYTVDCNECGLTLERANAYFYDDDVDSYVCESCYYDLHPANIDDDEEEEDTRIYINDYSYKPTPKFFTHEFDNDYVAKLYRDLPEAYFGVELEIDQCDLDFKEDPERLAEELTNGLSGFPERFYIKYDGSLNNGMEIVSHPHTYAAHYHLDLWKQIMDRAKKHGYTSHDAKTCGLHFHITSASLGRTRDEISDTSCKMVLITEVMWDQLTRFSRRTNFVYCKKVGVWKPLDTFNKFKSKMNSNIVRHNAINLCNLKTVEFRLPRGTLNYSTFIATLQLVYMLRLVAMTLSSTAITKSDFSIFIEMANELGFSEFMSYCKTRRFEHPLLRSVIEQKDMDDQSEDIN